MKTNDIVELLQESYKNNKVKREHKLGNPPRNSEVIKIIKLTKELVYPGFFTNEEIMSSETSKTLKRKINKLRKVLRKQINSSIMYLVNEKDKKAFFDQSCSICKAFMKSIPEIRRKTILDIEAHYQGDPAALNRDQIIVSYPGPYAILIYRIAHVLDNLGVQVIPRMMSEFAHRETGIDINPKAIIGESFFIDHGTGVVIGETAVIGDRVKIYQGVTLGAMSLRKGQLLKGKRRHPTIEDDVTIYSNASILGSETIIGKHSVIGANVFLTSSVPENSMVMNKEPELEIRSNKNGSL